MEGASKAKEPLVDSDEEERFYRDLYWRNGKKQKRAHKQSEGPSLSRDQEWLADEEKYPDSSTLLFELLDLILSSTQPRSNIAKIRLPKIQTSVNVHGDLTVRGGTNNFFLPAKQWDLLKQLYSKQQELDNIYSNLKRINLIEDMSLGKNSEQPASQ